MIWILAAILLLLAGLWLKLSLLVFAMYVLLGTLMLSRFFTRAWVEKILATPCGVEALEIGETAEMMVKIQNQGRLAIPWLLMEDSLPRDALTQVPQHLKAEGSRLALERLRPGTPSICTTR